MSELILDLKLSIPQLEILNSVRPVNLQMSGQRGGKTHLIGDISALFAIKFPKVRGFIGANTHMQLTQSTIIKTTEVWKEQFNLTEYNKKTNPSGQYVVDIIPPPHFQRFGNFKHYHNIISFNSGCNIFTGSLENYKAHDGKEFAWADLDETKDTRREALTAVILGRLNQRGIFVNQFTGDKIFCAPEALVQPDPAIWTPFNPIYIHTSPSEGQVDWLIEMFDLNKYQDEIYRDILSNNGYGFFKNESDNKKVVIYSTHHNEDNLPSNYIELRKKELTEKEQLKFIYGYPFTKSGGEFWHAFERLKHTRELEIEPDTSFHISLDFNEKPYMTLLVWQVVNTGEFYELRCLQEFCMKAPKNDTESTCEEFELHYGQYIDELYYYGDPAGKIRGTARKDKIHNWNSLEKVLQKYLNPNSNCVLRSHPGIISSKNFINKIFLEKFPFRIVIDKYKCPNLIGDLEFLKTDKDGKKLIEHVTDKETHEVYEKYGHTSDAMRYFICKVLQELIE